MHGFWAISLASFVLYLYTIFLVAWEVYNFEMRFFTKTMDAVLDAVLDTHVHVYASIICLAMNLITLYPFSVPYLSVIYSLSALYHSVLIMALSYLIIWHFHLVSCHMTYLSCCTSNFVNHCCLFA